MKNERMLYDSIVVQKTMCVPVAEFCFFRNLQDKRWVDTNVSSARRLPTGVRIKPTEIMVSVEDRAVFYFQHHAYVSLLLNNLIVVRDVPLWMFEDVSVGSRVGMFRYRLDGVAPIRAFDNTPIFDLETLVVTSDFDIALRVTTCSSLLEDPGTGYMNREFVLRVGLVGEIVEERKDA